MTTIDPACSSVRRLPRAAWAAIVVVLVAFAASRLTILGLASDREYDEAVYLMSARALLAGHELFTEVFSSQPPAFLETLALALRLGGDSLETGRLLVLAFSLAALALLADVARRLFGPFAAPAAAAALALSMTFGDLAHVVQAETPAVAFALASLAACLAARARGWSRAWLVVSGALLATACLFKLMALPLAAPLGLLLLLAPSDADAGEWRLDGRGLALLGRVAVRSAAVAAGAAAVVAVPLLVYDHSAMFAQNVAFHLDKQEAYRLTLPSNVWRTASHLVADPTISAAAAAGLLLLLSRRRLEGSWLLVWLVVMIAAVVQQRPLFWRHFVLLCPPLALAAAAAVGELSRRLEERGGLRWSAVPLLAALALWTAEALAGAGQGAIFPLWPDVPRQRLQASVVERAARWLRDHTADGELVTTDDPLVVYLAGRRTPPSLCDTSTARILAKSLTLEVVTREAASTRVVLLRRGGRLSRLPGFLSWLGKRYDLQPPDVTGLGDRRSVWLRKPSVRAGS